jgi:small subunit ribosomal protein S16
MAVKIRLQRKGRKASPFYHIVIADSRSPRDGRFIQKIGTYNPLTVPATIELNREAAYAWLMKGAQPTDTVRSILRFKGVLLHKHLQEGVKKGAITQEQADERLGKWTEQKEARIQKRREDTAEAKRRFIAAVDGTARVKVKPVPVVEAPVEDTPAAETEEVVEAAVETVEAVEAVVEAPAAEEEAAPAVEEAAADSPAEPEAAPAEEEAKEEE